MLTLTDGASDRTCRGTTRRELLRIGGLGLAGAAGLSLASVLALRERARAAGVTVRDRSVVLLFLQGGPSHIELFDPKMTAPVEIRSTTGEVKTTLPGVTFGGTFPKLARLAGKLAVVRSYASGNSGHEYDRVLSAGNPLRASASALYSRVAGLTHPATGLPRSALVLPEAIESGLELRRNFETGALPGLTTAGALGRSYEAFNPVGGGEVKDNMELRVPRGRLDDRRALLGGLDRLRRRLDADADPDAYADAGGATASLDRYQAQAFDILTRGAVEAFDLSREDPRTLARYDTRGVFDRSVLNRYNDMYRASNLLGHQLLLARRLCEAGCGFVTVADAGWDMHGNDNSLPRLSGIEPLGRQVDHAVAAFLEDVDARGLSDRILLVVTGEMGRTPRINDRGGRDHYGDLTSLVFAGGGLRMGQVIGRSDSHAARPATERFGPENLLATIFHALFDVGLVRLESELPSEVVKFITESQPIPGLL